MKISVDSPLPELSGMSLPERVEQLRRKMAAVPSRGESSVSSAPMTDALEAPISGVPEASVPEPTFMKQIRRQRPILPVPPALAELLPDGGLVRGSVVSVSGAGSLMLGIIAAVTAGGGHVAVIGQPRLGLLAAAEMGAELHRLALIPNPGSDPVEVAAILLEGLDLVVLGLGGSSVPPSRARSVIARARSKGSTLLVTDGHWDGVELRLDARIQGYGGMGSGDELGRGRLTSLILDVSAQGRASRPQTSRFDLASNHGRIEWVADKTFASTGFAPTADLSAVASL